MSASVALIVRALLVPRVEWHKPTSSPSPPPKKGPDSLWLPSRQPVGAHARIAQPRWASLPDPSPRLKSVAREGPPTGHQPCFWSEQCSGRSSSSPGSPRSRHALVRVWQWLRCSSPKQPERELLSACLCQSIPSRNCRDGRAERTPPGVKGPPTTCILMAGCTDHRRRSERRLACPPSDTDGNGVDFHRARPGFRIADRV